MKRPVVRAALLIDASCALSASLYIPMRPRCERVPTASTATRTDKMSKATEFGSCPDAYRSLNTEELSELLQNDDKMDQIIALDEKVKPWGFCLLNASNQIPVVSHSWLTSLSRLDRVRRL